MIEPGSRLRSPTPSLARGALFALALAACQRPAAVPAATPASLSRGANGIRRTLIARRPATELPGWETRLYLIEYGPGTVAPLHAHPAVGVGLVLDGRFESAFGDEPVVEVKAGQGFVDEAGTTHRVFRNPDKEQPLRFIVAYTLQASSEPFTLGPARVEAAAIDPPATKP